MTVPKCFGQKLQEEEFENTEGIIKIHKTKYRQHNGQGKRTKTTINDLQNITHKTKDPIIQEPN